MRMSTSTSGRSSRKRRMMLGSQCIAMLANALTRMTSLREDGWQKALQGITSVEEVLRVTV